jgi:hydroxymethylbilane synthase
LATPLSLRAATRGSALALWQTNHVAGLIRAAHPGAEIEVVVVQTTGDKRLDVPIHEIGGKGVFAKEVQEALLDGRADIAVHSAKDLQSVTPAGLALAAVPERGDPRDALVGSRFVDLAPNATIATGSIRRRAQMANKRRDLRFAELRGNIATRLDKAAQFDAILVAAAALDRLGLASRAAERLGSDDLLPQAGQGALAVECRSDDAELLAALSLLEHRASRLAVDAERAFLAELGGDCDLPAAAHAIVVGSRLRLDALIAAPDGSVVLRERATGADGVELGTGLATRLLDERGGRDLLAPT